MSDDSGSICIGCGLCCDGTLHGRTTVKPGDEPAVIACGLKIGEEEGKRFFAQPCPCFSCGKCSVYSQRPEICRTYRCALLKKLEAGQIGEIDARETIATAKSLIAAVRNMDPQAVTPSQRSALAERLREELSHRAGIERDATAKALLAIASLEHFLDRRFLKSSETMGASKS